MIYVEQCTNQYERGVERDSHQHHMSECGLGRMEGTTRLAYLAECGASSVPEEVGLRFAVCCPDLTETTVTTRGEFC